MNSALFVHSTKAEDENYSRDFQVVDVISLLITQSPRRMKNSINVYEELDYTTSSNSSSNKTTTIQPPFVIITLNSRVFKFNQ